MDKILLESNHGISTITFNRPKSYNALDLEMIRQLKSTLEEVANNDDPILILTGAGDAFSAGGDVKMMQEIDEDIYYEMMDALTEIALNLYLMPKIVIAAVNGSSVGLGFSLALQADFIVANEGAKFGMLFAGIGLIPDGGGHFLLNERLGTHGAKQFIWGLEQVQGKQAQKMGIVDQLVDTKAMDGVLPLIKKLQSSPLKSLIKTKMILHESKKSSLQEILHKEKEGQLQASQTKDHKEGVKAFQEKRKPIFKGE